MTSYTLHQNNQGNKATVFLKCRQTKLRGLYFSPEKPVASQHHPSSWMIPLPTRWLPVIIPRASFLLSLYHLRLYFTIFSFFPHVSSFSFPFQHPPPAYWQWTIAGNGGGGGVHPANLGCVELGAAAVAARTGGRVIAGSPHPVIGLAYNISFNKYTQGPSHQFRCAK
jgi:hypothetical protein